MLRIWFKPSGSLQLTDSLDDHSALIKREFPVCEDGGESKVPRSGTSLARS